MRGRLLRLVLLAAALTGPAAAEGERIYGGRYTQEKIENLRRNCERFEWARKMRDDAVERAQVWVERSDEELWSLIPGQDLPRTIDVTWDYNKTPRKVGCLVCGEKINSFGNYPYQPDIWENPWKLTCPSCGAVFPTNDFQKYYESAIDERALFNPGRGDRSLLYNAEHPDPDDPLHKFGVDDGFGYTDEAGRTHKFIGYYGWRLWVQIRYGIGHLATAYLYTGDPVYARKAALMLDRVADVYPDMDWAPYAAMGWYHSDGSSKMGKIEGRIWETGALRSLVDSYDAILSGTVDNPELYAFLSRQAETFELPGGKGTRADLVRNVDENIIRCGAQAIMDKRIWGNEGMHQSAMAACAVTLDSETDSARYLAWVFEETGGNIPGIILTNIDRDGCGGEGAPGYSLLWNHQIGDLAKRLADYPGYDRNDIFRDFPQFRMTAISAWRLCVLGMAIPPIGDSGATGVITTSPLNAQAIAEAFEYTGDPWTARAAIEANGGTAEGLRGSIYGPEPEKLPERLEQAAAAESLDGPGGRNLTGFGLASLEFGSGAEGSALWTYYGRMDKHGNSDRLNLGLYAFGVDLAPDLGYPEFAASWPHRDFWTDGTISHNTVVVDGLPQNVTLSGQPRMFKVFPSLRAVEVDSPDVYPGVVSEYGRLLLWVEAPQGGHYGVDLFRVSGGSEHLYSFHGPPGAVRAGTRGRTLALEGQARGTYAGEDVAYGAVVGVKAGYSFLYNVERRWMPPESLVLDWEAEDGYRDVKAADAVHLRLHSVTPLTELALADGDPPQNKPGNPRRIRYALLSRTGDDLETVFSSVLEPYRRQPFIRSVSRLPGAQGRQVALRIEMTDGTVDMVLFSPDGDVLQTPHGPVLNGRLGWLRVRHGEVLEAALVEGESLEYQQAALRAAPAYTGTVERMDTDLEGDGIIHVRGDMPEGAVLKGEHIVIENDGRVNACYRIFGAEREGELWKISCGPVSFVRGLADPADYSKGYVYNFREGAAFRIAGSGYWERSR